MFDTLPRHADKNAIIGFVAGAIDTDDDGLPDRLAEIEPGPYLAAILEAMDVALLSPADRVKVLAAQQRMASHFAAGQMESIDAIADAYEAEVGDDDELVADAVAGELRAGLTLTRRAAEMEVELALRLRRDLPDVWRLLASGAIDARKARVIAREVAHLDVRDARTVVAPILERASQLTTGQLGARLRRTCLDFDPASAHHRYNAALERRRLVIEPNPDGTADLHATDLPAERAMAIRWRIQRIARALKKADDGRTLDQIRTDVMLDLLEGTAHDGTVGAVEIRVELETLLAMSERAAEIPGYGPIVADIARKVAGTASKASFAVEHPDGTVSTGTTRAPGAASAAGRGHGLPDLRVSPGAACRRRAAISITRIHGPMAARPRRRTSHPCAVTTTTGCGTRSAGATRGFPTGAMSGAARWD